MRAGELPHITADILTRLRARAPRVHCITNAVAQTFTANVLLAAGAIPSMTLVGRRDRRVRGARRRAAGQSRHVRRGAARRDRDRARGRGRGGRALGARSGVHRPLRAARRLCAKSLVAQKPRAIRLNAREFAALSGARAGRRGAGALCARHARRRGADRHGRPDHRRRAARRDRERPSADGARDRDGLRGLRAERRVPRGRERSVRGDRRGAALLRCRGRARRRARDRAGQLSGGDPRCALCARRQDADRKGEGRHERRCPPQRHRRSGARERPLARRADAPGRGGRRDADPAARQAWRDAPA